MQITRFAAAIISPVILFVQGPTSDAAELKLKVADPLTAVVKELSPQFERDTGHKLIVKITPGPVVKRDIDAGEPFRNTGDRHPDQRGQDCRQYQSGCRLLGNRRRGTPRCTQAGYQFGRGIQGCAT